MYSPKIKEDLIPILYKLAKQKGQTMTKIVDEIIRKEIQGGDFEKGVMRNQQKDALSDFKKSPYDRRFEDLAEG